MHFSYIVTLFAAAATALPAAHMASKPRDAAVDISRREASLNKVAAIHTIKAKRAELAALLEREANASPTFAMVKRDSVIADFKTTVAAADTLVTDLKNGELAVAATFVTNLNTVVSDLETLAGQLAKDVASGALDVAVTLVDDIETAVTNLENVVASVDTFVDKTLTPGLFNTLNTALSELQTLVNEL